MQKKPSILFHVEHFCAFLFFCCAQNASLFGFLGFFCFTWNILHVFVLLLCAECFFVWLFGLFCFTWNIIRLRFASFLFHVEHFCTFFIVFVLHGTLSVCFCLFFLFHVKHYMRCGDVFCSAWNILRIFNLLLCFWTEIFRFFCDFCST